MSALAHGLPWTTEDDALIRDHYKDHDDAELAKMLGRSIWGVTNRRQLMGLHRVRSGRPVNVHPEVVVLDTDVANDDAHVASILAHGGFIKALFREQARAELRRRGMVA